MEVLTRPDLPQALGSQLAEQYNKPNVGWGLTAQFIRAVPSEAINSLAVPVTVVTRARV